MRSDADSHQDAQDALVEDRSMRPPNATRYRRDFHQEDARERAQEDDDLEQAAQHPFRGWVAAAGAATVFDDRGTDRRCFGRDEADNPQRDPAA